MVSGETIRPKDLHLEFGEGVPAGGSESELTLKDVQSLHIQRALTAVNGNVVRAAARLGMTKSTLYNKIRTLGIERYVRRDKDEKGAAASS